VCALCGVVIVLAFSGTFGADSHRALTASSRSASKPAKPTSARRWYVVSQPISTSQLTSMPWGDQSFWLQPWRSSLVTRSALSLRDAVGINLDNTIGPPQARDVARLLAQSGFARARLEIDWGQMDPGDVSALADPKRWARYIAAMRENHIRPLILVDGMPPATPVTLELTAPAQAGSQTISLSAGSARRVRPGRTHLPHHALITHVAPNGVAQLSQPLRRSYPAGKITGATLSTGPFGPPLLPGGVANPRFTGPLANWLEYVKGVLSFVAQRYGSTNFDVEIWNEGDPFLHDATYYSPSPDPTAYGTVESALFAATVQMLKDPANGLANVQIGDGFSNQVPWVSGTTVPSGTAAIDKHPYPPQLSFPGSIVDSGHNTQVNALAQTGQKAGAGASGVITPNYRVFMPEYYLTGIQTETLMRDLSPFTSMIQGTPHGAATHPAGNQPAPKMWISEVGMNAGEAENWGLPAADAPEMQAKAALRFFTAYASEGVNAIDLFAVNGGPDWQLASQAFLNAVAADPSQYPSGSVGQGGVVMQAVSRLVATLNGAQPIFSPRQLSLLSIASDNNQDVQFAGNGTSGSPSLYNRDVLAFFPFQVSQYKFVSSVYVMSSDLTHEYTSDPGPGQTPYDMPSETFRITIGNINGANATVSLYDPLTGMSDPATIVARGFHQVTVQLQATDSPRMLTMNDAPQ
jgi:hypothetical protein